MYLYRTMRSVLTSLELFETSEVQLRPPSGGRIRIANFIIIIYFRYIVTVGDRWFVVVVTSHNSISGMDCMQSYLENNSLVVATQFFCFYFD